MKPEGKVNKNVMILVSLENRVIYHIGLFLNLAPATSVQVVPFHITNDYG